MSFKTSKVEKCLHEIFVGKTQKHLFFWWEKGLFFVFRYSVCVFVKRYTRLEVDCRRNN